MRLGIPAERLSTVSFGETQPLFNEAADWAYAANRRVEVHVGAKPPEVAPVQAVPAAPTKLPVAPKAAVKAKKEAIAK